MMQPLQKTGDQFKKLNTESLYDPAILLLGLYPKELKTGACTPTFTTALLLVRVKL